MDADANRVAAGAAEKDPVTADDFLRALLALEELACPSCGCNLHRLEQPRCPGCGAALRVRVGWEEPYLGAWVLLLTMALAGGGIGTLWALAYLDEPFRAIPSATWGSLGVLLLGVPAAVMAIVLRKRFWKWSGPMQWICAASEAVLLVLATVILVWR